jgi:hypothetical protein
MMKLLSSIKARIGYNTDFSIVGEERVSSDGTNSSEKERHSAEQSPAKVRIIVLDHYINSAPNPQNVVDIFEGEWASKFPEPFADLKAGSSLLFEDPRISWAAEKLGGVEGKNVLELGPLEGGHTYMLERLGAASVLSIEANTRAYLKCLIAKEILELKRAHFLCGDFVEYLRNEDTRFDVTIASGVLYHMKNPVELIGLLSKVTNKIFIWTHYYDYEIISDNSSIPKNKFGETTTFEHGGFRHDLHRYYYDTALDSKGFCGGSDVFSNWMSRRDILASLEHFGFGDIQVGFDHPEHPNGPAFAVSAIRR